jgi:hypothetical protein
VLHENFPAGELPWFRRRYMKTKLPMICILGLLLAAAFIIPCAGAAGQDTGNGAISGKHYNLNLISVKKTDQLPRDANNGNRIFVSFEGRNRIYLIPNVDGIFNVLDADATDGKAQFTLPAPENVYDADGNYAGPGAYRIFVRVVGKPGGSGKLSTCGETYDTETGMTETVCSMDNVTLSRTKTPKFTDVTRQLTTVYADFDIDGTNERIDIFDPMFEDYLWAYDNNGLKNVQLRFYPITA